MLITHQLGGCSIWKESAQHFFYNFRYFYSKYFVLIRLKMESVFVTAFYIFSGIKIFNAIGFCYTLKVGRHFL